MGHGSVDVCHHRIDPLRIDDRTGVEGRLTGKLSEQGQGIEQRTAEVDPVRVGLYLRLADAEQIDAFLVGTGRCDFDIERPMGQVAQGRDMIGIACSVDSVPMPACVLQRRKDRVG